jgi:hypothetical protein
MVHPAGNDDRTCFVNYYQLRLAQSKESKMSTDPIELLRQLAPTLQNGHKEILKQAAELVKQLQAEHADLQTALARQPLPEAPASATAKVIDPISQMEWLITVREPAAARLLIRELGAMSAALADAGFIGFDAYVDQRRAERAAPLVESQVIDYPSTLPGVAGQAAPPTCPTHNRQMKPGKNGGWYCSAKIAENDGTGKPVYCKQKA